MKANEIREKYLKFFASRGHKIIAPAPLVLKDDPTTLFTSAGMQPLVPNLLGEKHREGKRLVDSQPCFRSQDIEEVGDNRHDTLFEMLGNWSLGDYFKKEQLPWIWEFLTKELNLPKEKLYITVFEGNEQVSKDEETYNIWKSLGISEDRIYFYGDKKNWWSRAGAPSNMPAGEPGGPSSEIFFEFESVTHDKKFGEKCHPNCDCGRFIEIANSVFVEYKKEKDGSLSELKQKNVDFGGGLERIAAAVNNDSDVFKTDLFSEIIKEIENVSDKKYTDESKSAIRIIADHIKASTFLIANGVTPSNKLQGYVLRRLLRRAAVKMNFLHGGLTPVPGFQSVVEAVIRTYDGVYFDLVKDKKIADEIIDEELGKFAKTLDAGLKQIDKIPPFDLFQSYGFPPELTEELLKQKGKKLNWEEFNKEKEKHQELSRKSSKDKFKAK